MTIRYVLCLLACISGCGTVATGYDMIAHCKEMCVNSGQHVRLASPNGDCECTTVEPCK